MNVQVHEKVFIKNATTDQFWKMKRFRIYGGNSEYPFKCWELTSSLNHDTYYMLGQTHKSKNYFVSFNGVRKSFEVKLSCRSPFHIKTEKDLKDGRIFRFKPKGSSGILELAFPPSEIRKPVYATLKRVRFGWFRNKIIADYIPDKWNLIISPV